MLTLLSSLADSDLVAQIQSLIQAEVKTELRVHDLRAERFAPCVGCFECWVKHPGLCRAKDEANLVMQDVIRSEAIIWLVEPRFGVWDPTAKAALDKCIGLLSPFFKQVEGETHHYLRYDHYPSWLVLAHTPRLQDPAELELFRQVLRRNTLNLQTAEPPLLPFEHVDAPFSRLCKWPCSVWNSGVGRPKSSMRPAPPV